MAVKAAEMRSRTGLFRPFARCNRQQDIVIRGKPSDRTIGRLPEPVTGAEETVPALAQGPEAQKGHPLVALCLGAATTRGTLLRMICPLAPQAARDSSSMLGPPPPPHAPAPLLFEDTALLVFDKPAGLLSVPGRGPERAECLAAQALRHAPDARIVHRLDMSTSGLIVLARGAIAQRVLSLAFAKRKVHKRYVAVVAGLPADDAGEIDLPLICDWPNRPRQMVDTRRGKASRTRWRVLARHPEAGVSRLELEPITGRSHQLRVHLQAIGHPILGDELYASEAIRALAPRLLLHASQLGLPHPDDGRPCTFDSTVPF